jgi:hypothetical protein
VAISTARPTVLQTHTRYHVVSNKQMSSDRSIGIDTIGGLDVLKEARRY